MTSIAQMPFLLPNPIPQRHLQILEVPKETELEETCEIMGQPLRFGGAALILTGIR